jgi:diacylglycerol kinase (ATP)
MPASTCVIYNPAAGRGRAERALRELPPALAGVTLRPTSRAGHATELARAACEEGFAKVVAAGGDGTAHEVANGILQSARTDAVFGVWPVGSANDLAFTLGTDVWWKRRLEALPLAVIPIDVGRVTAGGRECYFVNCFGVGFNGMVTVEAMKTKWLRGLPLYAWAFLKALVKHFDTPHMTASFDGTEVTVPTLSLSVFNAQREGNFPLRPNAKLDDGAFDFLHVTKVTRLHLLRFLPAMARGALPETHRLLKLGRAARFAVRADVPLCVHADGELVCVPQDGVREVEVELVPRRLLVEVFPPAQYGARG